MTSNGTAILFCLALICIPVSQAAQPPVLSDQGTTISRAELEYLISLWPSDVRESAANDVSDRLRALNIEFAAKKLAEEAEAITPDAGVVYWEKENVVRQALRAFMVEQYQKNMELPDFTALAKEKYFTHKRKYAFVPEQRMTSHILILCQQGSCDRENVVQQLRDIQKQLAEGSDFAELASTYSEDPGSKDRGGQFRKWLSPRTKDVASEYLDAALKLKEIGEVSDIVTTRYGYHLIRLDEVKESYYRDYEDVKAEIFADLEKEYRTLKMQSFDEIYKFSDQLELDGDVLDELFAPYKTSD